MEVRQATIADAKKISMLIQESALEFITPEFSPQATTHFLHANNQASIEGFIQQGFVYFVLEQEGSSGVALIGCIGMRNFSHIYHLFIAKAWQGKGYAGKLWQHALAFCMAQGNPGLFTVNSSNNAVGVYQALGFMATSPMQELHGVLFNPMQLDLRSST